MALLFWKRRSSRPLRPSDVRLGGVPYYIANRCEDCGEKLAPAPDNESWEDEFVCLACNNGVYLDLPSSYIKRILQRRKR